MSASGGEPVALTTLSESEYSHRWPHHLPDGRTLLFTAVSAGLDANDASLEVLSLVSGERTVVYRGGFYARYLETGHLAYVRDGTLFVASFDAERLEMAGPPAPIVVGVLSDAGEETWGAVQISFSRTGTLVYLPGAMRGASDYALVWVDRDGTVSPIGDQTGRFRTPRLSPDGTRLAVEVGNWSDSDVWIYELERHAITRLSFSEGSDWHTVWSPDGRQIAHGSNLGQAGKMFLKSADGAGESQLLFEEPGNQSPSSFSPDGKFLAFMHTDPETRADIWIMPMDGEGEPRVFLKTPFSEGGPQFSPDGRWLLYMSNESGRFQAYVKPFPDGAGKWQVSTGGARYPMWSPAGNEIFYRSEEGDRMMSVTYTIVEDSFQLGRPRELFQGRFRIGPLQFYDVSPDGERFVMVQSVTEENAVDTNNPVVVLNWLDEVERLAPPED